MNNSRIGRILLATIVVALGSCDRASGPAESKPPPRLVRTFIVESPTEGVWRELPGVVDAAQKADLGFRISGKLEKLLVNEGDNVRLGQELARLDDRDAQIQLNSRQADFDQAHADYMRGRKLVDKGLISRSDYEKLEAQDASARAALELAKQNLAHTSLSAPFAGRIAKRHVDNFEEVAAKQTIYTLQDLSSMKIRVDVPESVMIRAKEGSDIEVVALFDKIPGQSFPLAISEISTQANPDSNTFPVTFTIPRIDNYNILPGMSVTVRGERVPGTESLDTVFVPAQAVLEDDTGRYVYIAEPQGSGRAAIEKRPVKTGRLSSAGLEVLTGLEKGDRVVTAGMSKMQPGLEVRLSAEGTD
ncbi:MAG: efflux RND transporter periplasmic adaptor subunit [Candidatus Thiodiazotropha sp.]